MVQIKAAVLAASREAFAAASWPGQPADDNSPYRRIATDLRRSIESGILQAGDPLPTEKALGDRYSVATSTRPPSRFRTVHPRAHQSRCTDTKTHQRRRIGLDPEAAAVLTSFGIIDPADDHDAGVGDPRAVGSR